ncbi:UvrD-helicase-domain-containing protein [Gyrodon lividus]|nr:UvrD-helicase-domain-containing protein [Gyrodon lividus]
MTYAFVSCLNPAQSQCVEHPPALPLQILAGPGSGKTRVLTSRIAYLIMHHGMDPSSICAVTFTNKAANEMHTRLVKILGKNNTNKIKLGTFHAICALFLRKYGYLIGVERNFTICDADESKRIVAKLLKEHEDFMTLKDLTLKEGTMLSMISRAKAKAETPEDVIPTTTKNTVSKNKTFKKTVCVDVQHVFADVYRKYQKFLRQSNSLDFDDLLVFGVTLFSEHPRHTKWCRHVLVDEFQDTNTIQYELMCCIASANKCVTVVGDPDQSIYGWRSAEVKNLARMQNDFANVKQVFLEDNYRSAGSILAASMSIISQDNSRIPKMLRTSHPLGPRPMLRSFPTENDEASFVAYEINRLIAQTGGMLGYGDFAVLLRFNALSRMIETSLQRERIPNRILGGHKFFERAEIKDLLAYLRLVDNPEFVPAFSRSVNVPSRGIGEKALGEIIARAEKLKSSPLSVVEQICDHKIPDLNLSVKRKVAPFVVTIQKLRKLAAEGTPPSDLIRTLLALIRYEEHLKKTHSDWELRWENVQELINFASEDVGDRGVGSVATSPSTEPPSDTPLRQFLQASMLSSDGDKLSERGNEKVTITTCHAAKGLEWPVVIIPAVENGTFPFYRSEDIEEERRLLYVACTRAQVMLYLTHSLKRRSAGEQKTKDVSKFLSGTRHENPPLFSDRPPLLSAGDRKLIAEILGRESCLPDEEEVKCRMISPQISARKYTPPPEAEGEIDQFEPPSSPNLQLDEDTPTGYVPTFQSSRINLRLQQPKLSSFMAASPSAMSKPKAIKPVSAPVPGFRTAVAVPSNAESNVIPTTANKPVADPETLSQQELVTTKGHHQYTPPSPRQPVLEAQTLPNACSPVPPLIGMKRRLGMGRVTTGYSNKKFKAPIA